ncbi:hypothetical protein ABTY61_00085 [Kitasatospora sp. NPDC096128]|uniref:hypothetical protein n=1 Tax=Kitasatospora sp. NPDC096128 TaxID=3155547 RepID=UPI00332AD404
MTRPEEHVPKDPPVPVETPESRMTGEGGPPRPPEDEEGPEHGPESGVPQPARNGDPGQGMEPVHGPEPHEPPD